MVGTSGSSVQGTEDAIMVAIRGDGSSILWQKAIAGPANERAVAVAAHGDGFVVAANVDSADAELKRDLLTFHVSRGGDVFGCDNLVDGTLTLHSTGSSAREVVVELTDFDAIVNDSPGLEEDDIPLELAPTCQP